MFNLGPITVAKGWVRTKLPNMTPMDIGSGRQGFQEKRDPEKAEWQVFTVVGHPFGSTHILFSYICDSQNVLTYIIQPSHITYVSKFTSPMEGSSVTHLATASGGYLTGPLFFKYRFSG